MSLLGLLGRGFQESDFNAQVEVINDIVDPQQWSITGCNSPKKERSVWMTANTVTAFRWHFYNAAGDAVMPRVETERNDPTLNQTEFPARCALFFDPFRTQIPPQIGKIVYNSDDGLTILPPESVRNEPAIYMFEIYWLQAVQNGEQSQLFGRGLISVEESVLSRYMNSTTLTGYRGPITLSQIRTRIRDYIEDNDTLGRYEFSDSEIFEAIAQPVALWNETPPFTSRYAVANFPYREQWIKATVAQLLSTSAHWMLRNQVQLQGEGIGVDDRNKWSVLFQMAKQDRLEYEQFIRSVKGSENIRRGFAIL